MGSTPIFDALWTDGLASADAPPAPEPAAESTAEPMRGPRAHPIARLSVSVVWVATLAEQEALDLGHRCLGTEHLLLAVVRMGDAVGRRLGAQGATLAAVRRAILRAGTPEPFDSENGRPGWSSVAGAALEAARRRARAAGRAEVVTEDLVAALLAPGARATAVLQTLGVDPAVAAEAPGPVAIPVPTHEPAAAGVTVPATVPVARPAPDLAGVA